MLDDDEKIELIRIHIDGRTTDYGLVSYNADLYPLAFKQAQKLLKAVEKFIKRKGFFTNDERYYVGFAQINDDGRLLSFFVPIMHPSSESGKESSENEKAGRDIITGFCSLIVVWRGYLVILLIQTLYHVFSKSRIASC